MKVLGSIIGGIVALALTVLLVIGLYKLGWWITKDSTNRQTTIDRQSTAFVTSRIEKIRDDVLELASVPEGPQKANMTASVCAAVADIEVTTIIPSDVATFAARSC